MQVRTKFREVLSVHLAAIFIAIGAVMGMFRDGILVGALAGGLLYLIMMGIGWLCTLVPDR
jgi:hypothetical protein